MIEGFIVDPRKSTPEDFQQGMRDVKLVFDINHTMPYTGGALEQSVDWNGGAGWADSWRSHS